MEEPRANYISNRELLLEIWRSKNSYCNFADPKFARPDIILSSLEDITPAMIEVARAKRAAFLSSKEQMVLPSEIPTEDIVFRVMTEDHIPHDASRKRRGKDGGPARTNFPPFMHYSMRDGKLAEVGRSHWQGSASNGHFSTEHGNMSRRLADMLMRLVDRYARRGNWRNYCCDSDTEALTQRGWLRYDQITTDDMIMSFDAGVRTWSRIKSIYRAPYSGFMYHLTGEHIDALVTPHHKIPTIAGLVPIEMLATNDVLIIDAPEPTRDGSLVTCGVSEVDFHGAWHDGEMGDPTVPYDGTIWCPETEYGLFLSRRNGKVFYNGNTYLDEMKGHALLQLSQIALQFDESKSDNPFAYFTTSIRNCLAGDTLVLTREYGAVAIGKIAGEDVHLLDGNGDWTLSHIHDHGEQLTYQLTFSRAGTEEIVRATAQHGWITPDGNRIETQDVAGDCTIGHLLEDNIHEEWLAKVADDAPRVERVYCPFVPTTNSFALASGIHSANCFVRVLNLERRNQHIRDDLLIMAGASPSFTRQVEHEMEMREQELKEKDATQGVVRETSEPVMLPPKRGRKKQAA